MHDQTQVLIERLAQETRQCKLLTFRLIQLQHTYAQLQDGMDRLLTLGQAGDERRRVPSKQTAAVPDPQPAGTPAAPA